MQIILESESFVPSVEFLDVVFWTVHIFDISLYLVGFETFMRSVYDSKEDTMDTLMQSLAGIAA